jgi:hypothetical protein
VELLLLFYITNKTSGLVIVMRFISAVEAVLGAGRARSPD